MHGLLVCIIFQNLLYPWLVNWYCWFFSWSQIIGEVNGFVCGYLGSCSPIYSRETIPKVMDVPFLLWSSYSIDSSELQIFLLQTMSKDKWPSIVVTQFWISLSISLCCPSIAPVPQYCKQKISLLWTCTCVAKLKSLVVMKRVQEACSWVRICNSQTILVSHWFPFSFVFLTLNSNWWIRKVSRTLCWFSSAAV